MSRSGCQLGWVRPFLWVLYSSLCLHAAKGAREIWGGLFPKGTPPMLRGLPSRPNHLPKPPPPTIILGMRTWT